MRGFLKLIVFVAALYYGYGYLVSQGYIDAATAGATAALTETARSDSDQSKPPEKTEPHETTEAYYLSSGGAADVQAAMTINNKILGFTPKSSVRTRDGITVRLNVERHKVGYCNQTKRMLYRYTLSPVKPVRRL